MGVYGPEPQIDVLFDPRTWLLLGIVCSVAIWGWWKVCVFAGHQINKAVYGEEEAEELMRTYRKKKGE